MWEHGGMCSPDLKTPTLRCFVKQSLYFSGILAVSRGQTQILQPGPCQQVSDPLWRPSKTRLEQHRWNGEGKGWRGTAQRPRWTRVVPRAIRGLSRWHKFVTGFNQRSQGSRCQPARSQHSWLCWGLPAKPSHITSMDWGFLLDEQLILTPCRQHLLCSYCHNIPNPFSKKITLSAPRLILSLKETSENSWIIVKSIQLWTL